MAENEGNDIENKRIEEIKAIIDKGTDINSLVNNGKTFLHLAIDDRQNKVIEFLLDKGAAVNAVDLWQKTSLMYAAISGNAHVVELLIQNGADVNAVDHAYLTPLFYAVVNNKKDVVSTLLQHDADVNARDGFEYTPLMYATIFGNREIITMLIQNGANVNADNYNQQTPLTLAIDKGNIESVRLLIENGADTKIINFAQQTSLINAAANGSQEAASILIQNCANIKDLDQYIKPIISTLILSPKESHIKVLQSYLAKLDNSDQKQQIINDIHKVKNHKLLEALGSPPSKLFSLESQITKQLSLDLEKSPNKMKYTTVVNILNSIGELVSSELQHLINDYSFEGSLLKEQQQLIVDQLPKLSKHFIKEALYKDLSNIGTKFKIGKNHPVMEEIKDQLEKIYTTLDPKVFEEAKENLKLVLLKERVKHKLENENDVREIVNIIDKGKKQGVSALDITRNVQNALLSNNLGMLPEKINNMCNNFEILRPSHSIESLQYRIQHNALNQMNEDFRLEISAALDLTHTKMSGKEVLYRGINVNFSNREIQNLFETGHQKLSNSAKHLLFDKKLKWYSKASDWHANVVYTSFNPSISKNFMHDNSILFEYRPKPGELGIEGSAEGENQYEVLFNHLVGDNIKAIYKVENNIITDVFHNPYYEKRENEPELSFKEGEDLAVASLKYERFANMVYKSTNFKKNRNQYSSPEDFKKWYGKKEMVIKRQRLYEERGYKTYKEMFEALPKEHWPSTYIEPNIEGAMKRISNQEKLFQQAKITSDQEKLSQAATPKTSAASRISNPFSYISSTINQIKGFISGLEKEFMPETTAHAKDNQSYKTSMPASNIELITSSPNFNSANEAQSWITPERVVQAFDAINVIQKQVKLAKVLYTLGGQMLESSKQMAEDLLDEKVNKREFVDTLQKVTKDIETDVTKLDKLSEKLKQSGRSDSKLYRDELVDLEARALEIEQELKTFAGKEQMPKGRLEKLAKEFKKIKGKTSSPEKQPEITIENPVLKGIAEQYKTLSKEGKALLSAAKGKHNKPHQPTHEKQSKSKHKIDEKNHSPKNNSR